MTAPEFLDVNVSFRDAQHCARACQALLETRGLSRLWTDDGPTEEAVALFENHANMDAGKRALFLAAWAFWSGQAVPLTFDELMGLEEAEPISALMQAAIHGERAVDAWLASTYECKGAETKGEAYGGMSALFEAAQRTFAPGKRHVVDHSSPADACALGAFQMAAYLLIKGVKPYPNERPRMKKTIELTREMLEIYAELSRRTDEAGQEEREDSEGPPPGVTPC